MPVGGRAIQDNIVIAHEGLHCLKKQCRGLSRGMAMKLDIFKAFDSIEWGFLLTMLRRIWFNNTWCGWIEQCISTIQYEIIINGEPARKF